MSSPLEPDALWNYEKAALKGIFDPCDGLHQAQSAQDGGMEEAGRKGRRPPKRQPPSRSGKEEQTANV
jgi:hypothetical protein